MKRINSVFSSDISNSLELFSNSNTILSKTKNQVENKTSLLPIPSNQQEHIEYFKQCGKSKRAIVIGLARMSLKYRNVFPSQALLGQMAGISRQHCNVLIKQLVAEGIIEKHYWHRHSCTYKLSGFFKDPWNCFKIGRLIPVFCVMAFLNLTPNENIRKYIKSPSQLPLGDSVQRTEEISVKQQKKNIFGKPRDIYEKIAQSQGLSLEELGRLRTYPPRVVCSAWASFKKRREKIRNAKAWLFKVCDKRSVERIYLTKDRISVSDKSLKIHPQRGNAGILPRDTGLPDKTILFEDPDMLRKKFEAYYLSDAFMKLAPEWQEIRKMSDRRILEDMVSHQNLKKEQNEQNIHSDG